MSPRQASLLAALFAVWSTGSMAAEFRDLGDGQRIADFVVEAVYENESSAPIGARFRHVPSRFVLDVLDIQSLPQAFVWVNSPPPSDQGEPHTLEHLLLGKGNKGRYVASLEEMSLGISSAFTQQRRTCYHFSTSAGTDTFFDLFEAKLDAMLHPNFSDEEIRREVCNMGIIEAADGTLGLEENGTVYNEMVRSYEGPWGDMYTRVRQGLYGEGHPMALESGGLPAAIRTMQPADIRAFHGATHHLNNMGAVVAIGNEIGLDDCLSRLSETFARVEPAAAEGDDPATAARRLPPPHPAAEGSIFRERFPHQNPDEPGLLLLAWAPTRDLDVEQKTLLEIFFELLADGSTSNLYRKLIDSQTRVVDTGATSVFTWTADTDGQPTFLGLGNVRPGTMDDAMVRRVRQVVLDEIHAIAGLEGGSEALAAFNDRARNRVLEYRRTLRKMLDTPPRFGYRGTSSIWLDQLQHLSRKGGFHRNLAQVDELAFVEALLTDDANGWRPYLESWRLLDEVPIAGVAVPDPALIATGESERDARVAAFVEALKSEYGVVDDAAAIARYAEEYRAKTAEIDAVAASIEMPGFIASPPLTLDDTLDWERVTLASGPDLVASTFDNMSGGTFGFAFDLHAVPESKLVYVPALPFILTEIGVVVDGEAMPYDVFQETLRREILALDTYTSSNAATDRVELAVRGAGRNEQETRRAIEWAQTVLESTDLRPENIARIRDAVDQQLSNARNRMQRTEETWVDEVSQGYVRQTNPLYLQAECFLTQVHSLQRLRWLLQDAGPASGFAASMALLRTRLDGPRAAVADTLEAIGTALEEDADVAHPVVAGADAATRALLAAAVEDLGKALPDLPDGSLTGDLGYLCDQMVADAAVPPAQALQDLRAVLDAVCRRDNVRIFSASSGALRAHLMPAVEALVASLGDQPVVRHVYASEPAIVERLRQHDATAGATPVYVGLVNENTRSGVHSHSTRGASYLDHDAEGLLEYLATRLYGGGGAHSLFMKTWGAGLAYSNGIGSNPRDGRLNYYAERCPDLAQTMQFVVGELRNAPEDPTLGEYAISQAFNGIRSGSRYEDRAEAMARDLADGVTPDAIRAFRAEVLELRGRSDLYQQLRERMVATCGDVMPGLGRSGTESVADGATYFVIGPESQLTSWESYLKAIDDGAVLHRIYPRDYWSVTDPTGTPPGD